MRERKECIFDGSFGSELGYKNVPLGRRARTRELLTMRFCLGGLLRRDPTQGTIGGLYHIFLFPCLAPPAQQTRATTSKPRRTLLEYIFNMPFQNSIGGSYGGNK